MLALRATAGSVTLYWHASWGTILGYHASGTPFHSELAAWLAARTRRQRRTGTTAREALAAKYRVLRDYLRPPGQGF